MGPVLLVMFLATVGTVVARQFDPHVRLRRAIRAKPRTLIARTAAGPAHLAGRVEAQAQITTAPISGRACVAFELRVEVRVENEWKPLLLRNALPFAIGDESGEALVDPTPPYSAALGGLIEGSYRFFRGDRDPRMDTVEALLLASHQSTKDRLGEPCPVRYKEHVLAAGDAVEVFGMLSRSIDPSGDRPNLRDPPERAVVRGMNDIPLLIAATKLRAP